MDYYQKYKKYKKLYKYLNQTGGIKYIGDGGIIQTIDWYIENSISCSMLGTVDDNNLLILIEIPPEEDLQTNPDIGYFQVQRRYEKHGQRANKFVIKLSIFSGDGGIGEPNMCQLQSYGNIYKWCRETYIQQALYDESQAQGDAICPCIIKSYLKNNDEAKAYLDNLSSKFIGGLGRDRLDSLNRCLQSIPNTRLGLIVMEYIDNSKTLYDIILDTDNYDILYIRDCIVDAFYKLAVLNFNFGIKHNDFHLRNILINTDTRNAYFIDFSESTTGCTIFGNNPYNFETVSDYWILMDPDDGHMLWTLNRSRMERRDITDIFENVLQFAKTKYSNSGWSLFYIEGSNPDMSRLQVDLDAVQFALIRRQTPPCVNIPS